MNGLTITAIPLRELYPHPLQAEIYQTAVDSDFVASIQDGGIREPLVVTPRSLYEPKAKGYFIVSGHRRLLGAALALLETAPCIVKNYSDPLESELDLLISNKQREKTKNERIAEFLVYKQKLSQIGKLKLNADIYKDTYLENEAFSRFLESVNIDFEKPLNSIEKLTELTGFSKYEQEHLTVLTDAGWIDKRLKALRQLGIETEGETQLYIKRDEAADAYKSGSVGLKEAAYAVRELFAEAEKQLSGKKAKAEKAKADKKAAKKAAKNPPAEEPPQNKLLISQGDLADFETQFGYFEEFILFPNSAGRCFIGQNFKEEGSPERASPDALFFEIDGWAFKVNMEAVLNLVLAEA